MGDESCWNLMVGNASEILRLDAGEYLRTLSRSDLQRQLRHPDLCIKKTFKNAIHEISRRRKKKYEVPAPIDSSHDSHRDAVLGEMLGLVDVVDRCPTRYPTAVDLVHACSRRSGLVHIATGGSLFVTSSFASN